MTSVTYLNRLLGLKFAEINPKLTGSLPTVLTRMRVRTTRQNTLVYLPIALYLGHRIYGKDEGN